MLPDKTWSLDGVLRLLILLFISVMAGMILMSAYASLGGKPAESQMRGVNLVIGTICFHGAALVLIHIFLRQNAYSWNEAFGFNRSGLARALMLGAVTCLAVLPVAWLLSQVSVWVMQFLNFEAVPQTSVTALQKTESLGLKIYFGVVAIVLAPVVEEILFRGILYPTLKQRGYPRMALWGTGLLFAATHANAMTFVALLVLAIALVMLYENTCNLLAPIVAHSLFNLINFAWLVAGGG